MLLSDETRTIFNVAAVHRGTVVYAKRKDWAEGITGVVVETSAERLQIQFLPAVRNTVNHCFIPAAEAAAGLWEFRYSNDGLETVGRWPLEEEHEESEQAAE